MGEEKIAVFFIIFLDYKAISLPISLIRKTNRQKSLPNGHKI